MSAAWSEPCGPSDVDHLAERDHPPPDVRRQGVTASDCERATTVDVAGEWL